ncbi:MAG: SDR family NAD(P)-dependent oxidoreductase [Desulfobacteraceae bacterium]|nr:SDR family NAD(P)-dependent oxidoreductase [Desulfobacteraceae bacterium]
MALNLESIGKKIGPYTREYTWNDVVLYAMGVGAGFSDLEYCYEKDLKVIPSFSIASIADFEFLSSIAVTARINLAGVLHGEQELYFHNPIPKEGTLTTEGKITHMYDKGDKGALIIAKFHTFHSNGQKLYTSIVTIFSRLNGGFGGPEAPKSKFIFPDREPDFIVEGHPSENQPLLYRLSGDVFQLHVDPDFAKASGFEKPIMHGLCTHGYACRALISSLIPGAPEKVRRMTCRFSKTLYPGEPIETLIWKTEEGKAVWKTIHRETREEIITNGVFEYGDPASEYIRFDNRVAVVTGAGAGLGRAYALELARRGAKVVVNDYGCKRDGTGSGSNSPAEDVVNKIKAAGGEAVANFDNVATTEGGQRIVQTALDTFGTIDILINNAGILRDKSFSKMSTDNWQAVLDVHLNGAYNVSKPAFQIMKDKGYGRIILTTSAAGLYGNFGQTNYSAAKLALTGLMNSLKLEGAKYNIKVNTIAPLAASRLTKDILPEDLFEKLQPEFVSPMTLILSSEECPVTGNIYNVGAGCFNRAAVVTGPGAVIGNGIPAPEEVLAGMEKISSMEGAKPYDQLNDLIGDVMAQFTPDKKS